MDSGAGRSILIAKHCQCAELGARPEGDSYLGSHSDPEATRDAEPTLGGGGGTAAAALAARSRPVVRRGVACYTGALPLVEEAGWKGWG